ncbi:transposase [Ideonella sp. YS5]|uniref:transposase n=1 Tax=Ideonella sp. YS5 TaxID=3453714 RepID=UPI003EE8A0AE
MARQARLTFPGHPHHLLIRGNNRQPIFVDDEDRRRLLSLLAEVAREQKVAVHAYVLMPDHLHLLATPHNAEGLSRSVQNLGRRYVGAFNHRHGRSGTLYEGRYRAHLLGGASNVLACMRFIELNPQRVGLATGLREYAWSSLLHHLGGARDPLITDPAPYWALGNTPFEREAAYQAWLEQGVSAAEVQRMVSSLVSGRPLGDPAYLAELEKLTGLSLAPRKRGRPPKVRIPDPHDSVPN